MISGKLALCLSLLTAAIMIISVSSLGMWAGNVHISVTGKTFPFNETSRPAVLHLINNLSQDNIKGMSVGPIIPHPKDTIVVVPIYNAYVSHNTTSSVTNDSVLFPSGEFSEITVTYFNTYISNVFDTSFIVSVDNVQILAGNTLELENTSVSQNVTQYYSILQGKASVFVTTPQFNPGYASRLSVWFTFYLGPAAEHPNRVIPAFTDINFPTPRNAFPVNVAIPFNVSRYSNITFPSNIKSAYMEFYEQQNGNDEFWYTLQPPFREFRIYINNTLVATVQPYPNIQTGGGDLFLWQPILAIGAVVYPPHQISLMPFLHILKGKKMIRVEVINDESLWIRSALNFMLTTGEGQSISGNAESTFFFSNTYVQNPPTNSTTESIPFTASYLNDTESVNETLNSNGIFDAGISIVQLSIQKTDSFYSKATTFDPNFDIVEQTPFGVGLVTYENFSLYENITVRQATVFTNSTPASLSKSVYASYQLKHEYYQINGSAYEALIFSPFEIVIGFQVTQIRNISLYNAVTESEGSSFTTATYSNSSSTVVSGTGLFAGELNSQGVLTVLTYNHALTKKQSSYMLSEDGRTVSLFEQIEEAVNDSLISRNGVLVLNIIIMR